MAHSALKQPLQRPHDIHPELSNKYTALFGWGLRLADLAVVLIAGVIAYRLRFGGFALPVEYERALLLSLFMGVGVFSSSRLYRSWRGRGLPSEILTMLGAYTVLFVILMVYSVALKNAADLSRVWRMLWFVCSLAGGIAARVVIRGFAAWTRGRGMDLRSAVIVGGSNDARRIIDSLQRNRSAGIQLLGRFQSGDTGIRDHEVPYLGDNDALAAFVEQLHVDQVWIALPVSEQKQINSILESLEHSTTDIKFVPDLFGLQLLNHSVEQVAGLPVINLRASPLDGNDYLLKSFANLIIAALILVLIGPLLVILAIGVKLSSPGPVLFRQKRHGVDGRIIEVWKFRSMHVHEESHGNVIQATRFDRRVTRYGRFLRRTSLDELPQFINVLQGTMAVVGPRPHAVAHNHHYKDVVQDYMQRHRINPGITGWAQVNGLRGETDTVEKMKARVQYDLYYMQNWSLQLDLKIIAMTVVKGFFGRNAY
ncbi:MAG: undecaprenyl-phosphate glucose phosphotransferase [Xanthomonadaceae bacterium]|nr:undecaprenyl-phosphate glucose phosphotransferase [Xanthomonadaceae bacterium]